MGKKYQPKKPGLKITYQCAEIDPEETKRRLTRAYAVVFELALVSYERKYGKPYGRRSSKKL